MSIPPGQSDQPPGSPPPEGSPQPGDQQPGGPVPYQAPGGPAAYQQPGGPVPYQAPGGPVPYQPPPPPQGTSGLAIAGLILAFLFAPIGFLLSLIALFTTGKGRKQGKGLAVAGLIVSMLAMGIVGVLVATVLKNVATVADPGCTQGKDVILTNADLGGGTDPDVTTTKLQALITGLDKAATAAKHDEVRTAMKDLANDYRELLKSVSTGDVPDALSAKVDQDANRIDELCTIGGVQN